MHSKLHHGTRCCGRRAYTDVDASITVSVSGAAVALAAAPASVEPAKLVHKSTLHVFGEQSGLELQSDTALSTLKPGVTYRSSRDLVPVTLPTGTTVHTHFIHGDTAARSRGMKATFKFSSQILGVAVLPADLDRSDATTGSTTTRYPAGVATRGLDLATDEWIRQLDGQTLEVYAQVSSKIDQIRVFTKAPAAPSGPAPVTGATFEMSGYEGGGFVNVVEADPEGSGLVLSGSDVGGIFRSTDWGKTWSPANRGNTIGYYSVAAIAFSPTTSGKVYAAQGYHGQGGLVVSIDGGQTWETRSQHPRFNGENGRVGRTTGQLIAIDPGGYLYVATYDQGVLRSGDDGRTWTTLGLAGRDLRSLALDPTNPDVLYASTYDAGVFKTETARSAGTFSALSGSPTDVEELLILGSEIYGAAGFGGVVKSLDGGQTWRQIASSTMYGAAWISIDGYRQGDVNVVYAGANRPLRNGLGYDSVLKSVDGGASWTSLSNDPSRIHKTVGDSNGRLWWFPHTAMMMGGASYWANHITTVPSQPGRVLVAGKVDIWGTADDGGSWYPMARGLGDAVNRAVVADPTTPGRVHVATADWTLLSSSDGLATVHSVAPAGAGTYGQSLALDVATTPATVYLGAGEHTGNVGGEVWSNPDPISGGSWSSEGLGAHTGGKRVLALAVNRVDGNPVIVAAVEQGGVWRKANGAWSQVSAQAMAGAQRSRAASLVWPAGSSTAYLYDRETGVWRSHDSGSTWTLIWNKPSPYDMTGYLLVDVAKQDRLYVSVGLDGVYRLDGASAGTVGSGITPVKLAAPASPGALAQRADGRLFLVTVPWGDVGAALLTSGDDGASWARIDDDTYRSAAPWPTGLAVAGESVYVSFRGTGAVRGTTRPS